MDYKYIEQLLEKYWLCETSIEEEQILRAFFCQKDVPAHLLRYKQMFASQKAEKEIRLGEDFDKRMLAMVERPVVKARRLTWQTRMMPLFKAAAMMILLFTIGGLLKHSMGDSQPGVVYVYDQVSDKSNDPQVAYEVDSLKSPLKMKAREHTPMEEE